MTTYYHSRKKILIVFLCCYLAASCAQNKPNIKTNPQQDSTQEIRPAANVARSVAPKMAYMLPAPEPAASSTRITTEKLNKNAIVRTADQAVSTFSADVDTASYALIRDLILEQGKMPSPDLVRIEEMLNYFDYAYPIPAADNQHPFSITTTVMDSPWTDGKKIMHIGIQGYELKPETLPNANLVFLIDTSGSMNQAKALPLVKKSFSLLLDQLKPNDVITIVTYAGTSRVALPPTPASQKSKILSALNELNAAGSTNGEGALEKAYQLAEENFKTDGINRILLATDGDFNVGIKDKRELKHFITEKRKSGVYISVLGFNGHRAFRDDMMQQIAQNGNGVAASITSLQEARKVLVEQAHANLFPIAKDVKIQVAFNPNTVSEYRLLGYESRQLKREDFKNDHVDAAEIGSGHSVTAIYEFSALGSGSEIIERSRYEKPAKQRNSFSDEYAQIKLRYKLPQEDTSQEITTLVKTHNNMPSETLKQEVNYALAVATAGELLRGGQYSGKANWQSTMEMAQNNKGQDRYGYRAQFIQLLRAARLNQ